MRELVALAPNHWDVPWRNRQQVLSRLAARGWPIVYSSGPLSWWERESASWATAPFFGRFEERDNVSVFVPGRFPFRWPAAKLWDGWVLDHHSRVLSGALNHREQSVVVLYHPSLWCIAERLDPLALVYYPFDNFRRAGGWSDELAAAERAVVDRAAFVVASSKAIAEDLPGQPRDKVRILGNGVDFKGVVAAAGRPCRPEMASIPQPRIGYCGVINRKIDFALVEQIALQRPAWHWVFVGPERGLQGEVDQKWQRQGESLARCRRLPNVHFLGALSHSELFPCLHQMDVNVICNRADGGWWQDSYPLKFHEYLAAGKPVVSSRIDSLIEFSDVVDLTEGIDGWISSLERAISAGGVGTVEERRAVARGNDWDARALLLEGWLTELGAPEGALQWIAA